MAAKQVAEKLISEHFIAMFSKSWCPYCQRAKSILSSLSLPAGKIGIIELDTDSQGNDIQSYLAEKSNQRSVPNIYINGKHIGGCDDLTKLNSSGELKKLVAPAM